MLAIFPPLRICTVKLLVNLIKDICHEGQLLTPDHKKDLDKAFEISLN